MDRKRLKARISWLLHATGVSMVAGILLLIGCVSPQKLYNNKQAEKLIPTRGIVLESENGRGLFRQCSRSAPEPEKLWTPSAAPIQALEAEFPEYIQKI